MDEALHCQQPTRIENIDPLAISAMREKLTTTSSSGDLVAVCLGTPHFSLAGFKAVIELLAQRKVAAKVEC